MDPTTHMVNQAKQVQLAKLNLIEKFPASYQMALYHRQANKFGRYSNQRLEVCPCCEERVDNVPYPFCMSSTHTDLPASVALFFQFLKMVIVYLVLRLVLADAFNLITNWYGHDCGRSGVDWLKGCHNTDKYVRASISNKVLNNSQLHIVDLLDLGAVLFSIAFFVIYRFVEYREYVKHDVSEQTQDDYSIFVRNIPIILFQRKAINYEEKLSVLFTSIVNQWIARGMAGQEQTKLWYSYVEAIRRPDNVMQHPHNDPTRPYANNVVRGVELCWDLQELTTVVATREGLKDTKERQAEQQQQQQQQAQNQTQQMQGQAQYQAPGAFGSNQQVPYQQLMQSNTTDIDLARNAYLELCTDFTNKNHQTYDFVLSHFLGKAFVSFEYQHYAYAIMNYAAANPIYLDGNLLDLRPATAPRDVFWENMNITDLMRKRRLVVSFFVTLGTLIIVFAILVGLDIVQAMGVLNGGGPPGQAPHPTESMRKHFEAAPAAPQHPPQSIWQTITGTVVTVGMSLFVFFVNGFLESTNSTITVYEKHETKTNYQLSFMLKLLISQFITTAIMYYVISLIFPGAMWEESGLIPQMSNLILVSSFMPIAQSVLCSIFELVKEKCFPPYSKQPYVPIHQDRLNQQLELQPFDLSSRYTHYIMQVFTISFFAYPMPFGTAVVLVAFLIEFFIDKYRLFLRCSLKDDFNYEMTKISSKLFMSSVWIYALGNFIFAYAFTRVISWPTIVSLTAATLFMVYLWMLPAEWEFTIQDNLLQYEQFSYHYCQRNNLFEHTYRNQNPASKLASGTSARKAHNWFVLQEDLPIVQNIQGIAR